VLTPDEEGFGYLDDVKLIAREEATYTAALDYLGSEEVTSRGLHANAAKCACNSLLKVAEEGTPCLGAFIGPVEPKREWLDSKIATCLSHAQRLTTIGSREALILLRQCHSIELAHLLRCMDLEGLEDSIKTLDSGLEAVLDHIRGSSTELTEDHHHRVITKTLYHLPIRLGGVGLIHYEGTRRAARASFLPTTARILEPMQQRHLAARHLEGLDPLLPIRSQKERMEAIHLSQYRALVGHLNPLQLAILEDQTNSIHAAWITTAPTTERLALSDREVGIGLRQRTLQPTQLLPTCDMCGQPSTLNHQEACQHGGNRRTYRHNSLRDLFEHLVTAGCPRRGNHTSVEDQVLDPGSIDRTDLRVVGIDAPNGVGNDCDFTITAITGGRMLRTPRRILDLHEAAGDEHVQGGIHKHWIKVKYDAKMTKYQGRTRYTFRPLVFTTGGSTDEDTATWIKSLRKVVRGRVINAEISTLLLRYSAMISNVRN
jgi:hypothetical protein